VRNYERDYSNRRHRLQDRHALPGRPDNLSRRQGRSRKTGSAGLTHLAVGFGIVTFGTLLAGIVDQFMLFDGAQALVLENGLTMVGFGIIAYSLYVTRRNSATAR